MKCGDAAGYDEVGGIWTQAVVALQQSQFPKSIPFAVVETFTGIHN
jgi:hypothetical protein